MFSRMKVKPLIHGCLLYTSNNQGVAYLEDGTMIVVEGGKKLVGENTAVVVTSVLQTSAGRMIFAKLK